MEIGVVFPQTELGGDRGAVRAYGQAVADLGYAHLAAYDHVLGADTAVHGDIGGPYDVHDTFHEPLMLFAYLAGFTQLRFATSILIGPQRQTALLAKQAAELDIVSGGTFRLGLGIGWNRVEYEALGSLLRRAGRLLGGAGGRAAPALDAGERDGGRPLSPHHGGRAGPAADPTPHPHLDRRLRSRPRSAGSAASPTAGFPWPGRAGASTRPSRSWPRAHAKWGATPPPSPSRDGWTTPPADPDRVAEHAERWREAGASHVSVNTMRAGLEGVDAHIAALTSVAALLLLTLRAERRAAPRRSTVRPVV